MKGRPSLDAELKQRLTAHVLSCQLLLGFVAEPGFDADPRYHAVAFDVAKAMDGVLFNGQEMLDADGKTLATVV